MRILAALLVDAENISARYANDLYQVLISEELSGTYCIAKVIIGNPKSLTAWAKAIKHFQFQAKIHSGGKNAADSLLRDEALRLAGLGVRRLYLVSNDGGFVKTARQLHAKNCQIIVLGTAHVSRQLEVVCDRFFALDADPKAITAAMTPFNWHTHRLSPKGVAMNLFSSTKSVSPPSSKPIRELIQAVYGSAKQPPLLTTLLELYLQHAITAICLSEEENIQMSSWTPDHDTLLLARGREDPIINVILEQDAALRISWQAVQAFVLRCQDAYEQGRAEAHLAFPHFPRSQFNALRQGHLNHLLATWRYNPYAPSNSAQLAYPGYTPDLEQEVLLRWFRRGYLFGAGEEKVEMVPKKGRT